MAANPDVNQITLFVNNGSGVFDLADERTAGSAPFAVIAAELNGDNQMDLAVTNLLSNDVTVFLNEGGGVFENSTSFPAGTGPSSLTAVDIDNDLDNDLIVTNGTSTNLSVLRNQGDGTFSGAENFGFADFPLSLPFAVAAQDANGDGTFDVAIANSSSSSITLLKNQLVGGFQAVTLPVDESIADVNFGVVMINQPPTDISLTLSHVPEDADLTNRNVEIGTLTATDPDTGEFANHTFVLVDTPPNNDNASFIILGNKLLIRQGIALDFESKPTYTVRIEVFDGLNQYSELLTVSVTDVNESPFVSLSDTANELLENTDILERLKLADILIDDDALGAESFSLVGADASDFEIVGNELFLRAGTPLNFESQRQLKVTVHVDDTSIGGSPDGTAEMTLDITDVNELPSLTLADTTPSLAENSDPLIRRKVAGIVIDDDALGAESLSLIGPDVSVFEIVGSELFLRAGTALNFEGQRQLKVTVQIDDTSLGGSPDSTAELTLDVNDVNEPPALTLTNRTPNLPENSDPLIRRKIADIAIEDDALGAETLSLVGPDASAFEIVAAELFLRAGTLLDFEDQRELKVTVQVDDVSIGDSPDDTEEMILNVIDVNESPDLTLAVTTPSLAENSDLSTPRKIADIAIEDDAQGTESLSLVGPDASTFEIVGIELFIRAGTLLNLEGQQQLKVTVQIDDTSIGGFPDDVAELTLGITDVNEPPTGIHLTNHLINEDTNTLQGPTFIGQLFADDPDTAKNHTFQFVTDSQPNDNDNFQIDNNELKLRQGVLLDFTTQSIYKVLFEVSDGQHTFAEMLEVHVTDIDRPPTDIILLSNMIPENVDTGAGPVVVGGLEAMDDTPSNHIFSLISGDGDQDNALFRINGKQVELRQGISVNYEMRDQLRLRVQLADSLHRFGKSLVVDVIDVNEPPSVSLTNTTTSLPENSDTSVRRKVADIVVEDDALGDEVFSLTGSQVSDFEIVGSELFLRAGVVLDFEQQSHFLVTVQVDDATIGASPDDSTSLTLDVEDRNGAPSVSLTNVTTSLPENSDTSVRRKVADIVVEDDALGDEVLGLSGSQASSFEIAGSELFLRSGVVLDFEIQPQLVVTVLVDDPEVGTSQDGTATLILQLTDAIDWQNAVQPLDANRNGSIEPQDVLVIFNELNDPKTMAPGGRLPTSRLDNTRPMYDVSGDGFCTTNDALRIVNFLNNREGEGKFTQYVNEPPHSMTPRDVLQVFNEFSDSTILRHQGLGFPPDAPTSDVNDKSTAMPIAIRPPAANRIVDQKAAQSVATDRELDELESLLDWIAEDVAKASIFAGLEG